MFAGTATETVALTSTRPRPVTFAAFRNLTAVGAVAAAGTARFVLATLFVGNVHVEPVAQAAATPVIVEALVGKVWVDASLNCVEVMLTFQPPPAGEPARVDDLHRQRVARRLVVAGQGQVERRGAGAGDRERRAARDRRVHGHVRSLGRNGCEQGGDAGDNRDEQ